MELQNLIEGNNSHQIFQEVMFDFQQIRRIREENDKRKNTLCQFRDQILSEIKRTVDQTKQIIKEILHNQLIAWKRQQQLSGNGFQMTLSLTPIQKWCEELVHVILSTKMHIEEVDRLKQALPDIFPSHASTTSQQMTDEITQLLMKIVKGTFIVDVQPCQVMKTNTKFEASVQLLVGVPLNVHRSSSPKVTVSILSEAQAAEIQRNQSRIHSLQSGEISNNQSDMIMHKESGQVKAMFHNMQLKKIRRKEKYRLSESVTEEKFYLLFRADIQVSGKVFNLWTLSLPVSVIVHGNQECVALANVTWDNAFAESLKQPCKSPEHVTWAQMAPMLDMKWKSHCHTTRGLSNENIQYLASKLFQNDNLPKAVFDSLLISRVDFCREPLPGRNFSFWEWFYYLMKLTDNHLNDAWSAGYILGFVSRISVEKILQNAAPGTFVLRFSDSIKGGLTLAYLKHEAETGQRKVVMAEPFTTRILGQRSLADSLLDLQKILTFVYQV